MAESPAPEAAIEFFNVSCHIQKNQILTEISLAIPQGKITGILGPNGAGKSTLLSLITGLRAPSTGKITILSHNNPQSTTIKNQTGVVLQETALYEELTTAENLAFSAALYAVPNVKTRIVAVLDILGLSDRATTQVSKLSGGLRRRVAIARALLHDPQLLIIDEPTLGVDVEARHAIWSHLRLLRSQGKTIVVATNYLDEAQALCDTVAVLREGKVITIESPDSLVSRVGSCLDVTCNEKEREKITTELQSHKNINRIEATPSGLSIFLRGDAIPEDIVTTIVKHAHISEFRMRAPDLAEVFKALRDKV